MVKEYVPDRGELVWLDFNPQTGHEQAGHRPALILSPRAYNRIGLAVMCPVTTRSKGYPFEVELKGVKIKGFVLADQVKSLDWRDRGARYIGRVPGEVLVQVLQRINILLGLKSSDGFEEKSRIRSEMEECGFFVFKKGGEGMSCLDPVGCLEKADRWKKAKEKYIAIAETETELFQELMAEGKAQLVVSVHTQHRQFERAFSMSNIQEAVRNGWPVYRNVENGRPMVLLMGFIKVGSTRYRPIHVPCKILEDGVWLVKTVYDPSTRPWQWRNNFQDRVCFCKNKQN